MANSSEFELYLKDEHFDTILQAKLEHFYLFDPFRATFDPFFNNYTKQNVVDRSNYTLSESQEESVGMVFDT